MCMAATYKDKDHYFGRNLDLEISYGQKVVVTPRNKEFAYRHENAEKTHLALIGMAAVVDGCPLYFDATNENGLSMAGLNFPGNAHYGEMKEGSHNIAPFEFIPWVLCKCSTVEEARALISGTNLIDENFSDALPASPLHWIVSDRESSIVVEYMESGLSIYDDPAGILTNNPPFPFHMHNLANYMNLSAGVPENRFSKDIDLRPYSRGMGAMGLPGDLSSASRFVKAAFTKLNSLSDGTEEGGMTQFFHIMDSVQQQMGCCYLGDEKYEYTIYTSCCDTDKGIYYYRTYGNSQITGVDMHRTDLDSDVLAEFPLVEGQHVLMQN